MNFTLAKSYMLTFLIELQYKHEKSNIKAVDLLLVSNNGMSAERLWIYSLSWNLLEKSVWKCPCRNLFRHRLLTVVHNIITKIVFKIFFWRFCIQVSIFVWSRENLRLGGRHTRHVTFRYVKSGIFTDLLRLVLASIAEDLHHACAIETDFLKKLESFRKICCRCIVWELGETDS